MDDDKEIILTLQYEDGTQGKRKLLAIFEADNGNEYAALIVLNDDDSVQEGADIELVRAKPYQNENMEEDYIIERINSEAELQVAIDAFDRLAPVENAEAENDLLTLSFKNGNGQFEDWSVVDVFDHNGRKYIALIPLSEVKGNGDVNIHLMRLKLTVQSGIEGCEVFSIPSDMEYDEVERVFQNRVNEANKT